MTVKLLSSDLKNICYVDIALQSFDDEKIIVNGLFLGVRPLVDTTTHLVDKNELFMWLAQGDQVQTCNLFSYRIHYIDIGHKLSPIATYVKTSKFDNLTHKEYLAQLDQVVKAMKEADHLIGDGLIDVEAYTHIPPHVKRASFAAAANAAAHTDKSSTVGACGYKGSRTPSYTSVVKTVTTSIIKRTSKYPILIAAEQMKAKVQALREGIYKPPEVPEPVVPEAGAKDDTSTDLDNEYDGLSYPYGFC